MLPATTRVLLSTMTKEAFQPVRLYYSIPGCSFVTKRLRGLKCMAEEIPGHCWQWLYDAEAASLPISAGYEAVPVESRPIVLGRIRFPKNGDMTIQTNSVDRAVAAARFFSPRLGSQVAALRCRVINRCFGADEGRPDDLIQSLDKDVTVIDPRVAEEAFARDFKDVRSPQDAERVIEERERRDIANKIDIPMVEDFPLSPEEETPDFLHLSTILQLRYVRAVEHWNGNTDVTLRSLVKRMVKEGLQRDTATP